MLSKKSKDQTRQKVHTRIRKKLMGTTERPRLNVYRSVNHIYAQVIDDCQRGDRWFRPPRSRREKASRATSGLQAAMCRLPRKSAS